VSIDHLDPVVTSLERSQTFGEIVHAPSRAQTDS
jgi:hypothetical protein